MSDNETRPADREEDAPQGEVGEAVERGPEGK